MFGRRVGAEKALLEESPLSADVAGDHTDLATSISPLGLFDDSHHTLLL
jgi:hypothetical protein